MESASGSEFELVKKQLALLIKKQEHLEDALLSAEDEKAVEEAEADLKSGRTAPWPKIKKNR